MHTAESNFSNFVIEYLGEIETKFENTLVCLSGAQLGSNHEKTGGRKSRDTLPLRSYNHLAQQTKWNCFPLQNYSTLMRIQIQITAYIKSTGT